MRAAAALGFALAAILAAPALAQEPDRLERLAGYCRDEDGALIARYQGRVLWMQDGQLSGMLTRDDDAEPPDGERFKDGFTPRSMTVSRQTPEQVEDGLVLRTRVVFAAADGGDVGETEVSCLVAAVPPERPDPGATSRG